MSTSLLAPPGPAAPFARRACVVCGGPRSPRDVLEPVCAIPECRRRFWLDWQRKKAPEIVAQRERAARQRAAAETEARRLLGKQADAGEGPDASALPLALIKAWEVPRLSNLPEHRRRALRDHLTELLGQATAKRGEPPSQGEGAAAPSTAPELQAVLNQVCAFCEGSCCSNGHDHAYLTVDTLRRYLAAHPDRRPRDVLADYLDRVSHKTYRESCVYHGPRGCGLPREMRSETCNRHYCLGLIRLREAVGAVAPPRLAVVSHTDGVLRTAAVIDGGKTRVVPLPMAQTKEALQTSSQYFGGEHRD